MKGAANLIDPPLRFRRSGLELARIAMDQAILAELHANRMQRLPGEVRGADGLLERPRLILGQPQRYAGAAPDLGVRVELIAPRLAELGHPFLVRLLGGGLHVGGTHRFLIEHRLRLAV